MVQAHELPDQIDQLAIGVVAKSDLALHVVPNGVFVLVDTFDGIVTFGTWIGREIELVLDQTPLPAITPGPSVAGLTPIRPHTAVTSLNRGGICLRVAASGEWMRW